MGRGDLKINFNLTNCEKEIQKLRAEIECLRKYIYEHLPTGGEYCIPTVNGHTGCVINLTTDDIPEGLSNLYYTNLRVQQFADTRYALINHTHTIQQITNFPAQAGNGGYFLTTDGTNLYWAPAPGTYTDEQAQDAAAAMLLAGSHSNISFFYDDAANALSATVSFDPNTIWDSVNDILLPGTGILFSIDNTAHTISISVDPTYIHSLFSAGTGLVYNGAGQFSMSPAYIGKIDDAYDDTIIQATFSGSATKVLTLKRRDGTTLTASFIDNTNTDIQYYPNSLVFNDGILTLGINGKPALTTLIPLSELSDVTFTTLVNGQLLRYNSTLGKWENWTPTYLSTETDPVFTASPAATITNTLIAHWNTAYDKYPKTLAVSGTASKTITLTLNDGSVLSAVFEDLLSPNNYPTSLSFDSATGNLTLGRNGLSDLITNLDGRYLTECCPETDPIFTASPAALITTLDINHWNTAYDNNIVSIAVTGIGTTSKTIILTRRDGTTLTTVFDDLLGDGTTPGDCIDTNNYVTAVSFLDGVLTLDRLGLPSLTTNICFEELCGVNILSPTNGQVLVYNSTTSTWENGTAVFYSDEQAQDAVGNILTDSDSVDFTYDDTANTITATVKDAYVNNLVVQKAKHQMLRFRVGDAGYPATGTSQWTPLDDLSNPILAGKFIKVYRDGDRQYEDTTTGYIFDKVNGTVYFYPDLYQNGTNPGEWVIIEIYPDDMVEIITPGAAPAALDYSETDYSSTEYL